MSNTEVAEEAVKEENASEGEGEEEHEPDDYGEGGIIGLVPGTATKEFEGEGEKIGAGEYGEGGFFLYRGAEGAEYPSIWGAKEGSIPSLMTEEEGEVEETEEERELRLEREALIVEVKSKILDRMLLRRRNGFLLKKLVHHFKKRRMENVFKEEPKGLDLEKKYLRRLYAFQEFKQSQEDEIRELTKNMEEFEAETNRLEEELQEKLQTFTTKAKETSLNLILSRTGKRVSEKTVDRLLRRQVQKNEEKGKKKLQYIKIKNLIEEKERQLKSMELIGEGLYAGDYEQMKIDNQNLWDKIEEKEDELTKLRLKTQNIMQHLSQVREKSYAIEGDTELMAEKVYDVEKAFAEGRKKLTEARTKRDSLREELVHLKTSSGLLSKDELLRDFESTIYKAKTLTKKLDSLKKQVQEQKKKEVVLSKELGRPGLIASVTDYKTATKASFNKLSKIDFSTRKF